MKKKYLLLMAHVVMAISLCHSQNTDLIWYFGDSTGIDFRNGSANAISNGFSYSAEANANICDSNGNLLFCSGFDFADNQYIWNKEHKLMSNSSLISNSANTISQGLLILPFPGDTSQYYLFNLCSHITTFAGKDLIYHIIDMSADSGRGAVNTVNMNICNTCSLAEKMIGIRHANGRDWWLLSAEWPNPYTGTTGHFIRWLITPAGISPADTQSIGPCFESIGQISLSPTGEKVATAEYWNKQLNLYDFDRCTGLLSNWVELGYPPYISTPPINGFYGCSFSPSGRYLYASRLDSVFQFDITSSNIYASKVFLGKEGHVGQYNLGQHKLGPDGKIYFPSCNCQGGGMLGWEKFLNVINYPDSAGAACGLAFHSFSLGDHSALWGMPNIPDFNLGSVPGSPCDSLTGVPEAVKKNQVDVYPNPAHDRVNMKVPGNQQLTSFELYNSDGRRMMNESLVAGETTVKLKPVSSGLYYYAVSTHKGVKQRGKLCIIR